MYKEGISSDYLKYYRVIKGFMKIKHKLKEDHLDVLMFLYSEPTYDRQRMKDFESILVWDKRRWGQLLRDGWVIGYRPSKYHIAKLYKLSLKGNNVIERFYCYLEGKEIPMSPGANPAFKRNVSYTDKVYRNMIKEMNKWIYQNKRTREENKQKGQADDWPDLDGVYDY